MLQILNSKERNQAFLKFLLFFVITVLLVVFAIFFDFKMPLRENKMLYSEIATTREQESAQETFLGNLEEAVMLLDSLDDPETNFAQVNIRLSNTLNNMADMETDFSTANKKINKILVHQLGELQKNTEKIRNLKAIEQSLPQLKADLADCRNESTRLKAELEGMRSGN